jgi:hypothetical protein
VCLWYGASISGFALVLGGLAISTKKIWPRRKEVEEREVLTSFMRLSRLQWIKAKISEVICGLQWSKERMYMGHK